ncbi:S1C family serine protease [Tautonia sociabilis]|uniref:Trypsin-like serine protease n=1 Tax=Tautonia sociabilis TaxID=2080755 RepID=A0A432MEV6_9BACT|nr:trypsin-like peptidase domain-containing protein [Tautonia sociabilis]RUL84210.1 trypsin-like serine protease [Tautonia sociabilis]
MRRRLSRNGPRAALPALAALLGLGPGIALAAGPDGSDARTERVVLKDGYQVVGRVLAEKPDALFIDIGHDVIRVPLDRIVRRGAPDEAPAPTSTAATPLADPGPADGFYRTGSLPPKPVNELVNTFGEAVVSIETPSGLGSGFIINRDGFVVTNAHVIEGETRISAILYQKTSSGWRRRKVEDVQIIAVNPFLDLALLKLPPQEGLKPEPVVLGTTEDLDAGDGAFAVGNPLGLERSVSQGILSTLNRNFEGLVYLQTDAAINPGNSGGPLFNLRGEVIGVTNMKASAGDNLGFAIPISYVKDFLRNRDAFAYDKDNPNSGYRYLDPPRRRRPEAPPLAVASAGSDAAPGP